MNKWSTKKRPLIDRFNEKYIPVTESGCWLWTACVDSCGYGKIGVTGERTQRKASRISWELFRGEIPVGIHVLHLCDVPSCVNPDHLFLGTHSDNMKDRDKKNRVRRGERAGTAKLTWEQVRIIKNDARTMRAIAKEFRVSPSRISDIKNGKSWTNALSG